MTNTFQLLKIMLPRELLQCNAKPIEDLCISTLATLFGFTPAEVQ